jgi:hypothetical protein
MPLTSVSARLTPVDLAADYPRVRVVRSFAEMVAAPWADGVNALCWPRTLAGDFDEVVARLGTGEGIVAFDPPELQGLPDLSAAGRTAVEAMVGDWERLQAHGLDPALNCIHGYPRAEAAGPLATDVFSFHTDSAPFEADTWLCTYHGASSEGLRNDEARPRVHVPEDRAALLRDYGGAEGEGFEEYLHEHFHDLHHVPIAGARPFAFGVGHLWRIACEWPGSPVPPCIHRAPATRPGDPPRLLLIS